MCRGREHDERYGDLTARAERARVCSASAVYERRELMRVVDRKARTLPSPAALAGSRRALAGSRRALAGSRRAPSVSELLACSSHHRRRELRPISKLFASQETRTKPPNAVSRSPRLFRGDPPQLSTPVTPPPKLSTSVTLTVTSVTKVEFPRWRWSAARGVLPCTPKLSTSVTLTVTSVTQVEFPGPTDRPTDVNGGEEL